MTINTYTYGKLGIEFTEGFEGCRLEAYRDSGGILTIGYGHTGPDVVPGLVWTQAQADAALASDIAWAQATVNDEVTVPISQDENDALVDLVFNIGRSAFDGSTLLRELNAGDFAGAAAQFDRWDHAGGQVVAGLLRRREAETSLFEQGESA